MKRAFRTGTVGLCLLLGQAGVAWAEDAPSQSMEELRDTVINLLNALVQKGVITSEQAQAMVKDAQAKAAAQAAAQAQQQKEEQGAVRVPYIPEIVKDQIKDEIQQGLRADVTRDVVATAQQQKWGVPAALPDWITSLNIHGDMRVRYEADLYAADNAQGQYLNFAAVNAAGGIGNAGNNALLDTSVNHERQRVRLRLGMDEQVTDGIKVGVQFGFDNQGFPVSTNETLGTYSQNDVAAIYQAYIRYDAQSSNNLPWMTLAGGRVANPFYATALVWYPDLQLDGTYGTWRAGFGGSGETPRNVFLTAGAFPVQDVALNPDKWLFASQLGLDWPWEHGGRARIAATYYYFQNITGIANTVDSTLENYTAPAILQKGNTLFDISNNPTNPNVNLFALAADYHELNVTAGLEIPVGAHKVALTADYVNNIGYNEQSIFARTGLMIPKRGVGYLGELAFGSSKTGPAGTWQASLSYRHLQRDAVVDAFDDQDFHLGGTDAEGYILRADWWFLTRTSLSLRYFSANAIDGPPLGIDVFFVDINAAF